MPIGMKGFQPRPLWNGNTEGARKKTIKEKGTIRDQFTKKIYECKKDDMASIIDVVFQHALDPHIPFKDKETALKLAYDFSKCFVTRPTTEVNVKETMSDELEENLEDNLTFLKKEELSELQCLIVDFIEKKKAKAVETDKETDGE